MASESIYTTGTKTYRRARRCTRGTAKSMSVKAGPHTVGVTFLGTQLAPGSDLNEHFMRSTIETGGLPGFKFWPHVGKVDITGPNKTQLAPGDVGEPRKKIFLLLKALLPRIRKGPMREADLSTGGAPCFPAARLPPQDTEMLDGVSTSRGRNEGRQIRYGHRNGALETCSGRSREFVFPQRERACPMLKAGQELSAVAILELASRLSFFLWSSIPDDELINLASQNKLRTCRPGAAGASHARRRALRAARR